MVECPEYLLNFKLLEKLASKYGLKLVFKMPFNEFFYRYYKYPEYEQLLSIMQALEPYSREKVLTRPDEYAWIESKLKDMPEPKVQYATLSKSEWEAATLYLAFAFVKETRDTDQGNSS